MEEDEDGTMSTAAFCQYFEISVGFLEAMIRLVPHSVYLVLCGSNTLEAFDQADNTATR